MDVDSIGSGHIIAGMGLSYPCLSLKTSDVNVFGPKGKLRSRQER